MSRLQHFNAVAAALALLLGVLLVPGSASANDRVDVIIAFETSPTAADRAALERLGGEVRHSYGIVPAIAASLPAGAVDALARNPRVVRIEPDSLAVALDHEQATGELAAGWGVAHVGAGAVDGSGNAGTGVRIAIIDSGMDLAHADLAGNYRGGRDFVQDDNDPTDENGHGTHVAGTACAAANGLGVLGAAPSCDLFALRVLDSGGSGSWSDIMAAIDWAAQHDIDVANLSLGSRGHPGTTVEQAFQNAYQAGVLIVAAAGNSGNSGGNNDTVEYPARFTSVIAVAATHQNDARASFSSTGPDVELSAPGVSVLSTWNDHNSGSNPQPMQLCGGGTCEWYKQGSGTSMAAPHVAGVAALVIAQDTSRTPAQVRQILANSAIPLGPAHQYGAGLVYAPAAVGLAPSDPVTGTVSGTVTDSGTGLAIGGATVAISGIASTLSEADGSYVLSNVPEGTHSVTASATGYEAASSSVTIDATSTAVTQDFALTETTGGGDPPADIAVSGISPDTMSTGVSVPATITGTSFAAGATVTFENGNGPAPSATGVTVVDANSINLTVVVSSGGPPRTRTWDVRVTNPDGGSAVLPAGLTITP